MVESTRTPYPNKCPAWVVSRPYPAPPGFCLYRCLPVRVFQEKEGVFGRYGQVLGLWVQDFWVLASGLGISVQMHSAPFGGEALNPELPQPQIPKASHNLGCKRASLACPAGQSFGYG